MSFNAKRERTQTNEVVKSCVAAKTSSPSTESQDYPTI